MGADREPGPGGAAVPRGPLGRLALAAAALLAVAAVGLVGARSLWFPHFRPSSAEGERYGLDVSNHQGAIDWSAVADDDIEFVYIKATEGGDFADARFTANWDGAGAAGLERGAYHFFTLCRSGLEQAHNFLDVVPHPEAELPPVVDLELACNCGERPPAEQVLAEVDAFVEAVEAETSTELVFYVLDDFEALYPVRERFGRAQWERRNFLRPDREWLLWQFTSEGEVAGVEGGVDINVMRPSG